MTRFTITPDLVKAQIASLLVRFPQLQDDEEALALSLDSETDAIALLSQIVAKLQEAKATAGGLANWVSDLRSRLDRLERRQEALRALAFKIMETADVTRLELPLATLTISTGPRKVLVTDEKALPSCYVRTVREPAKVIIGDMLRAGHVIPGAELSNAEQVLRITVRSDR
jgi:Siphovirus Gp157